MALRGTLTHWKEPHTHTRKTISALSPPRYFCQLGVLEALWHVTAELAPRGSQYRSAPEHSYRHGDVL